MSRRLIVMVVALSAAGAWWLWPVKAPRQPAAGHVSRADLRAAPRLDVSAESAETPRVFGDVRSGGRPLAGAVVQLHRPNQHLEPAATTVSGVDGSFDFGEIPTKNAWVQAFAARHQPSAQVPIASEKPVHIEMRPCDFTFEIRVLDAAGAPIRAARFGPHQAIPDERGVVEMCYPTEWWDHRVTAPGFTPVQVTPGPGDGPLDVVLHREAILGGRVVDDESSAPLAGIQMWIAGARTSTAGDGTFRVAAYAGDRIIGAHGDGWIAPDLAVTLREGETTIVTLRARRTFAGRVRVVAGSRPAENERVCLSRLSSPCGWTDASGERTVNTIAGIEHDVSVLGREQVTPSRVTFVRGGPTVVVAVEPTSWPPPPANLRGRVTRLGVPVVDAEIRRRGAASWARSRDDGSFELYVPPGKHVLDAFSRELLVSADPLELDMTPGETREVAFEMVHASAIGGIVVDASGNPVPDGSVSVYATSDRDGSIVRKRRDGSFYIGGLAPGTYRALVYSERAELQPLLAAGAIVVPASDSIVSDVRLVVDTRAAAVSGRVVDAAGHAVAGVMVMPYAH